MFGILRIFIGVILGVVAFLFIFKFAKTQMKRQLSIITALAVVALVTVLGFVPFENLVYSFKSAEDVYGYYYLSAQKPSLVVDGNQSDLVVGQENDTSTLLIVPKTDSGWKIGIGLNTKKTVQKIHEGIVIYVYRYKNTNDYYVTVFNTNGGELNVTDAYNTEFYPLKNNNSFLDKSFVTYYAYVSDFNSQYCVMVNGDRIEL